MHACSVRGLYKLLKMKELKYNIAQEETKKGSRKANKYSIKGLRWVAVMVMMMAWMMPARAQTRIADGMYYIKVTTKVGNNSNGQVYLWRAITEKQAGQPYLSGWNETSYTDPGTYNPQYSFGPAHCTWIIKQVTVDENTYYTLLNLGTNQYVVWDHYDSGTGRAVHLETRATAPTQSDDHCFFKYETSSGNYYFHPDQCTTTNRGLNYKGDFNTGGDCLRARDSDGRGLIQFYNDTKNAVESAALLTAPTISDVDPETSYITITDNNDLPSGYNIRYEVSTNGNPPENPTATSMEGGSYFVESPCIIKAVVERYGIVLTNVATSGTLQPAVPNTPTFTVTCDNKLELSCANMANAHIYYTVSTNGTPPADPDNNSAQYTGAITLNAGDIVKAIAYNLNETLSSSIGTYTHQIVNTEAPELVVTSSTIVTITGPAGSTIYYTTNGVDPEIGASGVNSHASPVEVDYGGNMMDIRAIAQVGSLGPSCVAGLVTMGKPIVNIETDDCSETAPRGNVIVIPLPSDGSTIWYAVTAGNNSTAPEITAIPNPYTQYTGEVSLDDLDGSNAYYTVHAYAKSSDGSSTSAIETVSHQMKTGGKPELTPPVGSNPVLLISGGVFGDVAVCRANGVTTTVPITSDGTAEYTIPAAATGNLVVTFRHGVWPESLCSATYEIPDAPEAPTWSQECDNRLSLSTTSPMAVIHYEIGDNDNPPAEPSSSSNTYTEGCLYNIEVGTIVRAKAFEGFRASEEMLADPVDPSSGYYVHHQTHVAAPTFFVNGTEVTIRCATSGASIYYTVSTNNNNNEEEPIADPADPDPSDPTQLYTTEYTLTGITKIKAIAVKDGMENSCQILVTTREGYSITNVTELNVLSGDPDKRSKYWFIENDFNASGYNGPVDFTGVLVGNYHTISGLTKPLFNETDNNAVVRDLNLKSVNIPNTTSGNVGAIVCTAKGNTRIYNCGILPTTADGSSTSQVGGDGKVGGMVGVLQGTARVINCFSYANITGGTHKGGIVGYNDVTTASTQSSVNTMIMNCMFYGEIDTGGEIAPIYGGKKISNSGSTGLNNFNYFRFNSPYVTRESSLKYNCALGARDRYLERFEFFRLILNSNRELASWYIKSTVTGASERVGHWVLDKSVAPYPILKTGEGVYPSIINPDAAHAIPIDPDNEHRNEGRKLGELTVKITAASGWTNKPTGAGLKDDSYATTGLTINITDKDEANYNFNYKKIQLPYYNDVGTNNYTDNKVVTGWKITAFEGGTPGTFSTENFDYPCYNFVDRACTNKDLYDGDGTDGSDRVFNQGAYYEVPDGVTKITIEPYWANCVYLSDAKYDVTYNGMTACPVSTMGDRPITFNGEQAVYNNIATALSNLTAGTTVYDAAVVLVGNYHHFFNETSINPNNNNGKPLTIMSADMDNDNEPDNSFFYQHYDRRDVKPLRFDFINIPGIGMAQKEDGKENDPQPGIFHATGWFEITNTVLIHFGQFEFADKTNNAIKPIILHGGIYEQYVSTNNGNATYQYMFVGGNAWFKEFNVGCHTRDGAGKTPKHPVSVAGGEYEKFYLSGRNKPEQTQDAENAECYIDGGKFGEVAGAGMQQIVGNVTWLINGADIQSFFGGGINYDKPITGTITTTIRNSWVDEFCGGPKFGNMSSGMAVTTEAIDCHFGKFFGAGYGGTAYNRKGLVDESQSNNYDDKWNTWVNDHYKRAYNSTYHGVSTSYEYEYFFYSGGRDAKKVGRFYVNFASLSLASTQDVTSTLMGCTIGDFYGGGKYGSVNGDVVSTLTDCTVTGDAFGSGYSAAVPTVEVTNRENSSGTVGFETKPYYNNTANVFNDDQVSPPVPTVTYTWKHANSVTTGNEFDEEGGHFILTTENLDNLGAVFGNATLTINGNTVVKGDVYGGGAKSSSNTGIGGGTCTVNINGGTYGVNDGGTVTGGNIYGGGMGDLQSLATPEDPDHSDIAVTEGIVEVNIGNSSQSSNNVVIHGSVFGCNNVNGSPKDNVTVHIYKTKHNSNNIVTNLNGGYAIKEVFGGGNKAHYTPTSDGKMTTVHIHDCDNTIEYIYGGGNAADVGSSGEGIKSATNVIIEGGRHKWLFGGGNGAGEGNPGANIYDDVNVTYHAGDITYLFGGSNEKGRIGGEKNMSLDNDGACSIPNHIAELYGGNNKAAIEGNSTLNMPCPSNDPCLIDYLFGGSRMANISGNVELNVYGGLYNYVFGGNNLSGTIGGNVTLNLYGGTINEAAFGGNNQGGFINGKLTVNMLDQGECPLVVHNIYGGGNEAAYSPTFTPSSGTACIVPEVNLIHGTVSKKSDGTGGNVYGGGLGSSATVEANPIVNVGYDVSMATLVGTLLPSGTSLTTANVTVAGNVFGGGEAANVAGSTVVIIQKVASSTGVSATTTVGGDVYGGGALADVNVTNNALTSGATTTVTLDGGTVGNIYGGGLGQKNGVNGATSDIAAKVYGPVQVTVNGGTVTGSVYGCNNLNGAPQSTVKVDIYGTDPASGSSYALGHVFGGGNQAAYGGVPVVKVHNCDNSIEYVYGGGNAASVRGTDVTIYGGNTIGNVFGGCYGADVTDDGTDVKIHGGTILKVFGGNNQSGEISGDIQVNVNKQTEEEHASCPMKIDEVYGGGNVAGSAAGSITIGCTGDLVSLTSGQHYGIDQEGIRYVYGGANRANISGNISLTIASGIVENVFGGNNSSGDISGSITVNIEKDNNATCAQYWYVGNVYGGGNQAKYQPTTPGAYPAVNIKNGTVSQNVFGGGLGATAKVYSNPVVTVGDVNPDHSAYQAVVLGNVHGGGSAAMVGDDGETPSIHNTTVTLQKANSSVAKLFGGGMAAGVTGTTTVNVNNGTVSAGAYGGCDASGEVGGNVTVNVTGGTVGTDATHTANIHGGGYGTSTSTEGNVVVNIGAAPVAPSTTPTGDAVIWGDVYGGSALGNVNGSNNSTTVTLYKGTINGDLYGGGLGDSEHPAAVNGSVQVTVNGGTVTNVFGCNNVNGAPQSTVQVNINETTANTMTVTNVYGGGNQAAYSGSPDVNIQAGTVSGNVYGGGNNITTDNAGILNSNVEMTGGTVLGGVYGGCNTKGTVTNNSLVKIYGGTVGSSSQLDANTVANVFGGGLGADTKVSGNVEVNIGNATTGPTLYGDVYGGSALGSVNSGSSNTTTVNILNGTLVAKTTNANGFTSYTGGNVFGGGLGEADNAVKGKVNGKVVVNIGAGTPDATSPFTVNVTNLSGNATIGGNVYGCNNSGGSPQDDVTVNIFQTAHTEGNAYGAVAVPGDDISTYAIANVFGGGNEADFNPTSTSAKTYVNVYTCVNTIRRVFGGGNAAATPEVVTHIQGGRFFQVFGGGNGERGEDFGANVNGHVRLNLHGGNIGEYYGGSNQNGTISGSIFTEVLNDSPCPSVVIEDFFCGGNFVTIYGDLVTTIACSDGRFTNLYGGCNQANIYGNVVLNLEGGTYTNVFGGSKGVANGVSADILAVTQEVYASHPELEVGHGGNVTLNLHGGKIDNVFGGSNINGNIEGTITVNVLDKENSVCPLVITNIYGGSNLTHYQPANPDAISPVVNVVHALRGIAGNVYGGSKGAEGATGDDVTKVVANPLVNIGYDASTMNNSNNVSIQSYVSAHPSLIAAPRAIVSGSVFGGGDAAKVVGNTTIYLRNKAKVFGNVYGGGNMGEVEGDTKVIVNGMRVGSGE